MKRFLLPLLLVFFVFNVSFSQDQSPKTYFVVIGVFAKVDNAIRFTKMANDQNFQAAYAINPLRNLYYVHVLETQDRRKSFAMMIKMRAETNHKETWVFIGSLGEVSPVVKEPDPVITEEVVQPVIEEVPVIEEKKPEVKEEPVVIIPPVVETPKPKPPGNPYYFRLVNSDTGSEVRGDVHVLESSKATEFQSFNGNELVYLLSPKNTSKTYLVSVQAPGYKFTKVIVDYKNPTRRPDDIGPEGEAIITLSLVRAKKGDYIEFNDVRFYRNAAVFQPESQNELDGLVDLMKESNKYKIRVHGHTNGKDGRDVVSKGSATNFFDFATGNIKETTSAKRLSELRAELVKEYLVAQGINGKRIKIKGDGGTQMIYPPNSTLSSYNDRVEIEVMKH